MNVAIKPRFGVQAAASIPDITRTALVPRPTGALAFSESFSGLGDVTVLGWYRLNAVKRWTPLLNVGLSLPTGRTEAPRFRSDLNEGNLVPLSRLQRGSGTVDPIVGLNLTWGSDPWTRFVSFAARVPLYENGNGLRTGAVTELSAGVARYTRIRKIGIFGRASWLHREQDVFRGTPVLVGGGDWLYFTPGVGVLVGKGVNLQAEVKIPLYRSLANKQLDSRAVYQLGVSRAF